MKLNRVLILSDKLSKINQERSPVPNFAIPSIIIQLSKVPTSYSSISYYLVKLGTGRSRFAVLYFYYNKSCGGIKLGLNFKSF